MTGNPGPFPAIRSLSVVPIARNPNPITWWVITPVIIRGRPIVGRWGNIINGWRGNVEKRWADKYPEAIMTIMAMIPRGRRACYQQQGQ